ncbi:uncharacterized protein LOC126747065 [Anthonomus grandis grandis]|uniref:uncharacterized protein LOC126734663 n=1 Tax=Anthonomus grandis grandis TaxID=2921223 RepID=UPI00216542F6|nr:uncharacterized protein LOC126734663 [Anthonomus grandis grandis]XP_050295707.1 uncharacterized protein LOC126735684 [Anthonomus grandis grandis]XP_050311515.1 uncharacterized protein LOC126747065 [Anthonomus grandis grandis]
MSAEELQVQLDQTNAQLRDVRDALANVIAGLRSHVRADTEASPAEFLFGTTLRMPGEFFLEGDFTPDPRTFIEEFREFMRLVRPVPVTHHHKRRAFVFKNLYECSHIFLRNVVAKALERTYSGPYKVVKRLSDRVFDIDINGKTKSVSVELLKPAYLMSEDLIADTLDSDPPLTTPSSLAGTQDSNGAGNSPVTSSSLAGTHDLDGPGDLPVPMVEKVLKTYARKKQCL